MTLRVWVRGECDWAVHLLALATMYECWCVCMQIAIKTQREGERGRETSRVQMQNKTPANTKEFVLGQLSDSWLCGLCFLLVWNVRLMFCIDSYTAYDRTFSPRGGTMLLSCSVVKHWEKLLFVIQNCCIFLLFDLIWIHVTLELYTASPTETKHCCFLWFHHEICLFSV